MLQPRKIFLNKEYTLLTNRDSWNGSEITLSIDNKKVTDENILILYEYYTECIMDNYSDAYKSLNTYL